MAARPIDFNVRVEAVDGADIVNTGTAAKSFGARLMPPAPILPTEGVTISDAGILRGPPTGDDPPRRRNLSDINQTRNAIRESPRYRLARAVAGVIGRNAEDLLERDQLLDSAVSEVEDRLSPVPLRASLWTPAQFSITLVFDGLERGLLNAYNDETREKEKRAILKDACAKAVRKAIIESPIVLGQLDDRGGVTAQQLRAYLSDLDRSITQVTSLQDPLRIRDEEVLELVRSVHNKTVVSIGQLAPEEDITFVAYESLPNGRALAAVIGSLPRRSAKDVVEALKTWDKNYNQDRLEQVRQVVSQTNNARLARRTVDQTDLGYRSRIPNPSYGYPARVASLPEFSMQVKYSAKLNAALDQALEHVRSLLQLSWKEFGTRDAIHFHAHMSSESVKVLFARYAAYLVRKAELSTKMRTEDRATLAEVNYEITRVLMEMKAELTRSVTTKTTPPGKHKTPFYRCASENPGNSRYTTSFGGGGGDSDESEDGPELSSYGEPLIYGEGGKRKRQGRDGKPMTGSQVKALAEDDYIFNRFVVK